MHTRVIRKWQDRLGRAVYEVSKLDYWEPADLRKAYPDELIWQYVDTFDTQDEAERIAARVADNLQAGPIVVAEFGAP